MTCALAAAAACSGAESEPPDASTVADAGVDAEPEALRILVVNEVAAAGQPDDWFEVVNATDQPVTLSDFVFVDEPGNFDKAVAFPSGMTLGPGEYFVQECSDPLTGFGLGSDEEVYVYRATDQALSDGTDWAEGASPGGGSWARVPDTTGEFQTVTPDTRGAAND